LPGGKWVENLSGRALKHYVHDGIVLDEESWQSALRYVAELWTYAVKLIEVDASTDTVLKTHAVPAQKR
jgi:stage V sporulation protein R